MVKGKFATPITCMDGRIQLPIINWIKENYAVDYVDTITEPGADKQISENLGLEHVKTKVDISINAHKSELILMSGHYDCAGNPVSNEEHMSQIKNGVDVIKSWNYGVQVIGLWIDEAWTVAKVS
jgi:hypothetical protein